jgi:competence ComEA-like helix-hairpin-helix protein
VNVFTPAERRGALAVLVLLLLGCGWDLWRLSRPLPVAPRAPSANPGANGPGERDTPTMRTPPGPADSAPAGRLDLNRAGIADLDGLPGIGPVLAARIVEHRERSGRFARIEDLLAVRGIGPRLFARLAPLVTVLPAAATYKEERSPGGAPDRPRGTSGFGVQSAAAPRPVRADSTSVLHGPSR